MMSKFPTTIKADAKIKALHNAMPSTRLERTIAPVAFSEELLPADVPFIFAFSIKMKMFSLRCYAEEDVWLLERGK
jgi:hypothetical protein